MLNRTTPRGAGGVRYLILSSGIPNGKRDGYFERGV